MHFVASIAEVPAVPPAPHASLVANLSVFFIVSGVALVLSALSPVRRAAREAIGRTNARLTPRPAPAKPVSADANTNEAPQAQAQPAARREIEAFDLDIFV
jgi:hypothetical protein